MGDDERHICGPSKGPKEITRKAAEVIRDNFLHDFNVAETRPEAAAAQAPKPAEDPSQIIFGKLAELWRTEYVEKVAAGRPLIATPTRAKYIRALENYVLPRWKDAKIADLKARHVLA